MTLTELPARVTPVLFRIWIVDDVLGAPCDTVSVAVATTPPPRSMLLMPNSKQV